MRNQIQPRSSIRLALPLALAGALAATVARPARAQDRPTVPVADYGRWENLGSVTLSPDGAWIAYGVSRVNEENELRYRRLAAGDTQVAAWGSSPEFSPDSRWLTWSVGVSEEERKRLEAAEKPVRTGAALLDLRGGDERAFDAVRASSFDATGRFLALHGYAAEEPEAKGADLRVLDLSAGSETTFGNVGEYAWSDSGSLLALAIATGEDAANGVQVFDAASGRIRSLDASGSAYRRLVWRESAADLVALRSYEAASEDGEDHEVIAWRGLDTETPRRTRLELTAEGLGPDMDVVRHDAPRWSDDGTMISIGLRPSEPDEDADEGVGDAAEPGVAGDDEEGKPEDGGEPADDDEPELPGVQIWHTSDVRVFAEQKVAETRDGQRTLLAVWQVDRGRVVRVGTDLLGSARVLEGWRHALEDIAAPYGWGEMFGRPYHDVWQVDLATGARSLALEHVRYEWPSAGGGYLVTYDGADYASLNLATGERRDLTSTLPTVFADTAYDTPTDVLPPHGFTVQWLERDAGVLINAEHDVWRIGLDGSSPTRLTNGAAGDIEYRVAFLEDDDVPGLDPDGPIYLTAYGVWSEKRGYARVLPGGVVEDLVFDDKLVSGLVKADSADVYVYRSMAFDDPPDYFAAGPDLSSPRQVTEIDPFITEYAWGRSELVDFTSEEGRPLQAVLYYPANYVEGRRVPTIVYTYEMRSPSIHQFGVPSERSYYNFTAWTQHGYAVLQPDIVYTAREPGMSALASVRAAVAKVVAMGVADPDAVGLIGHSWGGYQATFLPTRTNIFAASVAGAPLTDFVSFMGQMHWNGGVPELSHWETGQGRMEVPFWEDEAAHRRNSPIHKVQEMETPLLMAFGDDDGTVDWDQGTEFYNFARRAGKQMVLIVYEGENHGFSRKPNQIDYHRRILEWFGHYLKGEPAPAWITDGVKLEDLEDEKRRVATKGDG